MNAAASSPRARWIVLALLTAFSVVSYVQRVNISIAAKLMMPELSLNAIQMGQIFSSFMLGYCAFQVPAGMLGDRFGPKMVLACAACVWGVTTLLSGLVPGTIVTGSLAVFVTLIGIRLLLGAAEAATYPVAALAVANWVPAQRQALGNALVLAGMPIGSAITPPLVSWLMVTLGWRASFVVTASLAFLVAILWMIFVADRPEQKVTVAKDATEGMFAAAGLRDRGERWHHMILSRNVVLLSLSYFFEGYVLFMFVFWFYTYLIDVRKFSLLAGGLFASAPWLLSAVTTPAGGLVCDRLARRYGRLYGSRLIVMTTYAASATLLFLGIRITDRYFALAALSISVGCLMMAEPAFWSSAIELGRTKAGTVSGIMNSAGILGGVVSTALVPILVNRFGWEVALGSGCGVAIACAMVWLAIRGPRLDIDRSNPSAGARALEGHVGAQPAR